MSLWKSNLKSNRKKKGKNLCVLQLRLVNVSVLAEVVHPAGLFRDLLVSDLLFPAFLVVLHRRGPNEAVFTYEVKIAILPRNLLRSDSCSHLVTLQMPLFPRGEHVVKPWHGLLQRYS